MHVASCMIVILTMLLSSEYHQHASCLGANFNYYFFVCGFPDCLVWPSSG